MDNHLPICNFKSFMIRRLVDKLRRMNQPPPEVEIVVPVPPSPTAEEIAAAHVLKVNQAIDSLKTQHLTTSWGDRLLTIDKTAGFKDDPAFHAAFESVKGSHIYDQYSGSDTVAWRLNTLCWAARCALKAGGDFVECGVFKGDFAWVVLQTLGVTNIPKFFLYDSFEGFSPDYSDATDYPLNPGFLDFANKHYQVPGMYEYVRDRFAGFSNVEVVKGFLPDALALACPERIGFLHVDLNSPRAEVGVLEQLFDRVVPGGVIVFDDYGWKLFEKQKEAEDEFMKARGYEILELPTGQGLVVKR
jgi:O-methyltransferase